MPGIGEVADWYTRDYALAAQALSASQADPANQTLISNLATANTDLARSKTELVNILATYTFTPTYRATGLAAANQATIDRINTLLPNLTTLQQQDLINCVVTKHNATIDAETAAALAAANAAIPYIPNGLGGAVTLVNKASVDSVLNSIKQSTKTFLGPNINFNNDPVNGSLQTALPIVSNSAITAKYINVGTSDDGTKAYLTIDNIGNVNAVSLNTTKEIKTKSIVSQNGNFSIDDAGVVKANSAFTSTTYSSYTSNTTGDLVVNKAVLEQVVQTITGSSSTTISALQELLKAFSNEDESILNSILKVQNEHNNTLLKKIDTLYYYLFQHVSGNVSFKTLNGSPASSLTVSDLPYTTIENGEYKLTSSDTFVTPVLDTTYSISGTGSSSRGPGKSITIDVNTSGVNAGSIINNIVSDAPVTTITDTVNY
jgi:hypothetical protein